MSKKIKRNVGPYLSLIFIIIAVYFISGMGTTTNKLSYSEFQKNLEKIKLQK